MFTIDFLHSCRNSIPELPKRDAHTPKNTDNVVCEHLPWRSPNTGSINFGFHAQKAHVQVEKKNFAEGGVP